MSPGNQLFRPSSPRSPSSYVFTSSRCSPNSQSSYTRPKLTQGQRHQHALGAQDCKSPLSLDGFVPFPARAFGLSSSPLLLPRGSIPRSPPASPPLSSSTLDEPVVLTNPTPRQCEKATEDFNELHYFSASLGRSRTSTESYDLYARNPEYPTKVANRKSWSPKDELDARVDKWKLDAASTPSAERTVPTGRLRQMSEAARAHKYDTADFPTLSHQPTSTNVSPRPCTRRPLAASALSPGRSLAGRARVQGTPRTQHPLTRSDHAWSVQHMPFKHDNSKGFAVKLIAFLSLGFAIPIVASQYQLRKASA
ncbi:hypothetical protein EVG20_g249 [Dentipellis fragilis]|uniref:Cytochrome c oxidase polypeptide VIIc n=1 Tax=Dentipellis fragilis TaxID=205917 RepID=A0A4Y9ZDS6_9AGAM|nr:hypothetical protein EVG20_g249 [Dentipellis fragilis]